MMQMSLPNDCFHPVFITLKINKHVTNYKTVKALLSPWGAYLISDTPEGGGLSQRGTYSQNQMTRIYMIAFQFLYPIFCGFNIDLLYAFSSLVSLHSLIC